MASRTSDPDRQTSLELTVDLVCLSLEQQVNAFEAALKSC
jgi:hypothetical protein